MLRLVIITVLLVGGSTASSWSKARLRASAPSADMLESATPLYLPSPKLVQFVTLGFNNVTADVLWFQTVNYFGKRFRNKQDLPWFGQMCDLVTSLDPRDHSRYEFCGTLLSWLAHDAETSTRILTRAVDTYPDVWRYRYLRGFNYWYFLERRDLALEDLKIAAQLPGAPPLVASIASRIMATDVGGDAAIEFLQELLRSTRDRSARAALIDRMKRARLKSDIEKLEEAKKLLESRMGKTVTSLTELVEAGIVTALPDDPFGGKYFIDPATGVVQTTSGEKGLDFRGKTAETGIMRHEFQKAKDE